VRILDGAEPLAMQIFAFFASNCSRLQSPGLNECLLDGASHSLTAAQITVTPRSSAQTATASWGEPLTLSCIGSPSSSFSSSASSVCHAHLQHLVLTRRCTPEQCLAFSGGWLLAGAFGGKCRAASCRTLSSAAGPPAASQLCHRREVKHTQQLTPSCAAPPVCQKSEVPGRHRT